MKNMRLNNLFALCLIISCSAPQKEVDNPEINPSADVPWLAMFQENSLEGWHVLNGAASYENNLGVITGTTTFGTPNTFLATNNDYSDFILEFEVLVDSTINSGVQFRSNSLPEYKNGIVHGYQCEIDPSPRAWSGGIYDEQRRGWLYDLENNPRGKVAFKNGQWNKYRIEAIGPKLRAWVNDINTSNLVDSLTSSGFIALQVHAIGDSTDAGKQIQWRNVRIITRDPANYVWTNKVTAPEVVAGKTE
jgi:hypothetical protein